MLWRSLSGWKPGPAQRSLWDTQVRASCTPSSRASLGIDLPKWSVRHHPQERLWSMGPAASMPNSRQRQLSFATQLTATRLDPKKPISEQVGRYEELTREYERVSGSKCSENARISTLVAAALQALQGDGRDGTRTQAWQILPYRTAAPGKVSSSFQNKWHYAL